MLKTPNIYEIVLLMDWKIDVDRFWKRVDLLRDRKGISICDIQEHAGKRGSYMYVVRSHRTIPSTETIVAMADKLGCSVDYLLGCDKPMNSETTSQDIEMLEKIKSSPDVYEAVMSILRLVK